jgi:hypothetical protein
MYKNWQALQVIRLNALHLAEYSRVIHFVISVILFCQEVATQESHLRHASASASQAFRHNSGQKVTKN